MAAAKSRSLRRVLFNLGFLLLAMTAIGLGVWLRPKKTLTIRTTKVQFGSINDRVNSSVAGDILPEQTATVRSQINAPVVAIHKEIGQRVKKGELIVQLDDVDLRAQISQSEAAIRNAKAQVRQSQAHMNTLSFQEKTIEALFQGKAATEREHTDAKNALHEAMATKNVSAAQVAQNRAAKLVSEATLSRTQLRAPFDGVLADLPVHLGDGMTIGSTVFQVVQDGTLHLEATLDEADAAKVQVGQEATLTLDALPNLEIQGHVTRIDPIVKKDSKGARTLTIEVGIDDLPDAKHKGLKAGMSSNVEIIVAKKENVLYVPSSVIIGRGLNQYVYALAKEGSDLYRVHRIPVTTGISNWEYTEIQTSPKESSLKQDDLVVASLNEKGLEDGVLVKLEKEPASENKGGK